MKAEIKRLRCLADADEEELYTTGQDESYAFRWIAVSRRMFDYIEELLKEK